MSSCELIEEKRHGRGHDHIEVEARRGLAHIAEGDTLRTQLALLRRFLRRTPADTIELKRRVAARALELSRYPFA
ncbi:MAG: hypothetical protein ABSB82_14280 [Terriglobia bacterium]